MASTDESGRFSLRLLCLLVGLGAACSASTAADVEDEGQAGQGGGGQGGVSAGGESGAEGGAAGEQGQEPSPAEPDAAAPSDAATGGMEGGGPPMGGAAGGGVAAGGAAGGPSPPNPVVECKAPACDDLEAHSVGAKPGGMWGGFEESLGKIAVSDGRAFSGSKAVRFTLQKAAEARKARMRLQTSSQGKQVYLRAMVFLEDTPQGQSPFHWNMMRVEATGSKSHYTALGGGTSGNTFRHYWNGSRDCWIHGGSPFPVNKWVCVEFWVDAEAHESWSKIDGKTDELLEIIGSQPLPGLSGCLSGNGQPWTMPTADTIRFGLTSNHPAHNDVTLWMDDLTVAKQPLGCAQARP